MIINNNDNNNNNNHHHNHNNHNNKPLIFLREMEGNQAMRMSIFTHLNYTKTMGNKYKNSTN